MLEYLFVFVSVIGLNLLPLFGPPTWMILALFYVNAPFDPFLLALVGAIASCIGRYLITYLGTYFERFFNKKRRADMHFVGRKIKGSPAKSFLATFGLSLSPISSSVYFIAVGLVEARTIPIFLGFFVGRLASYYVLILTAQAVFDSLAGIVADRFIQVVAMDGICLVFVVFFVMVDWRTVIEKRKLKFIPIRIRK